MTGVEVPPARGFVAAGAAGWWTNDVWRSDVSDLYLEALDRRLVVISAPAGYGKSVLARQWCEVDPTRPVVRTALTGSGADVGILTGLADELRRTPTALVVVDDVQETTSIEGTSLLRRLVDMLPVGCQLVLVSRRDPEVGLARWRATGTVLEIGADRLAMDLDMTTLLLWAANVPMSGPVIEDLHQRTEGWPGGLALAARSLRAVDRDDPLPSDLDECERVMTAHLRNQVYARQDADVRRFLRSTAALPACSMELCAAVLGAEAAALLPEVVRSNLFVLPVAGRPGWYRYHRCFRDLLRDELAREDPSARRRLETRGAEWHQVQLAGRVARTTGRRG